MHNEIKNNINADQFNAILDQIGKMLTDSVETITDTVQNIALEQAVQGKVINAKNNLDFQMILQYIEELSITLRELIKNSYPLFAEEQMEE
ncbi:hypothetical protein [Domibacillus robiginosus]|uniref:hypothetical protein n=1 Tax=Domibacillus robiginosus TaxID=1071054 RepID=UPI00067C4F07|nr:hypothetical protein [Domibacillus robiginosus]